ncbi:MAG: transcriptional regulator [Alphaproteobacteria bacterium PA4]|nr:MAG: transcriptional regulator [Alphaproteobacteria bacterium PA4]
METTLDTMVDRLAALAQPHRLAVFRLLVVAGPDGRAAGDIAMDLGLPASSLSFHLAHLKRAGLVTAARAGRSLRYAADFGAMRGLVDFLTENCCAGADCAPAVEKPGDGLRALLERNVA